MVGTPTARIDDALTREARAGTTHQLFFANGVDRPTGNPGTEKIQGAQRFRTADAISGRAVLTLMDIRQLCVWRPKKPSTIPV